jgi:glycosyltransferase involved in cell wall biosynthesis
MGLPFNLIDQLESANIPFVVTLHDYWYVCANAQLITNTDNSICGGPDKRFQNCSRCVFARAGRSDVDWMSPVLAPLMGFRNSRLRRLLSMAHRVIAPTEFVRKTYLELGISAENMIVIPHGIDVPGDEMSTLAMHERPQLRNNLHIGYIGSLGWQKGVHHLVGAVNQLPYENVKLTLYGDLMRFPDYVNELRKLAEHPGIHFAGLVSRNELWSALASLDLVVLPTLWYEVSPLTIQEVFAAGVPLVASRIGAMSEKITHGVDGLLFPPGDEAALRDTLLNLLNDPDLLSRLQAGIRPVRTISDQFKEIDNVYRAAC